VISFRIVCVSNALVYGLPPEGNACDNDDETTVVETGYEEVVGTAVMRLGEETGETTVTVTFDGIDWLTQLVGA